MPIEGSSAAYSLNLQSIGTGTDAVGATKGTSIVVGVLLTTAKVSEKWKRSTAEYVWVVAPAVTDLVVNWVKYVVSPLAGSTRGV